MTTLVASESSDLHLVFADVAFEPLRRELARAGAQQRMRVTGLPAPVLRHLGERLQAERQGVVRMLADVPSASWEATPTKIIELRNTLSEALLVLVPPGIRTAAEDSLDIATFTELTLPAFSGAAAETLLAKIPQPLRGKVDELIASLREQRVVRNEDEVIDYLATVTKNGSSEEAAGGALYVFGLVPDFDLFTRPQMMSRISRNRNASEALADVRQPLTSRVRRLPLTPGSLQNSLFAFLRERHCDDTRSWSKEIATDAAYLHLSIDKWPFADNAEEEGTLRLILEPLNLRVQSADEVANATALPVLDVSEGAKEGLKVSFKSLPLAAQAPRWTTFRIQLLSVGDEQPAEVWESNSYPKPKGARKAATSRTVKADELRSLPEGTYVLRVNAYDKDGTLITTPERVEAEELRSRFENESDPFLIVHEKTAVIESEPRAIPVPSLMDGWVAATTKAKADVDVSPGDVTGAWAEPINAAVRGDTHFRLSGEGMAAYAIVIPGLLRKFEHATLSNPEQLGALAVRLEQVRRQSDVQIERQQIPAVPTSPAWTLFLETRTRVFSEISGQHRQRNTDELAELSAGIVETTDLGAVREAVVSYARAYLALAQSLELVEEFALLARLDTIELRWRGAAGDPGKGILLGPTHPLRLLWHLQHALFAIEGVRCQRDRSAEAPSWKVFFDEVRRGLLPINMPPVLFDGRGRGYVENGCLTPFWSLYLPDRAKDDMPVDVAIARDTARQLLGVKHGTTGTGLVTSTQIAERLLEYLQQHPYVEQLRLNVFNPGDGEIVAEALRAVERERLRLAKREPPSLRYSVQMFGSAENLDRMGEAVESLLDPERQVSESDEEFTLTSSNHLLPKLVFAKNTTEDFLQEPDRFAAHTSILLEQFAVQSRLGSVEHLRRGSFVRGLVHETETQLATGEDESVYGWHKGLRPAPSSGADALERLLIDGLEAALRVQAAAAARDAKPVGRPIVALQLGPRGQGLLKHVHEVSDWVLTVDRNLGLDYFDGASSGRDVGYLLDFAPEFLQEDRQRLLLTTRSSIELEGMVRPALEQFGLSWKPGDELVVLENLRSLSGRLALRLLSSSTQAAEVAGLLLARLALEEANFLSDRLVIPLDAHRRWFSSEKQESLLDAVRSQQRADLLLVSMHPRVRRLSLTVVEVKLREELDDARRVDLYGKMRAQSDNTVQILRRLFDPDAFALPRVDRLLRAKEFSTILAFYAKRAHRYRLLSREALDAALEFAQDLDGGYSLDFHAQGIAFEQRGLGEHHDEDEPGYKVHRFGLDVANGLLERARSRAIVRKSRDGSGVPSGGSGPVSTPSDETGNVPPAPNLESLREAFGGPSGLLSSPTSSESTRSPLDSLVVGNDSSPAVTENPPLEAAEAEPDQTGAAGYQPASSSVSRAAEPPAPKYGQDVQAPPKSATTAGALQVDALLGASELTVQHGLLGRTSGGERVAVDLLGCNTISMFGVQGFGKSYTLGVIAEMATMHAEGINLLPAPLGTVVFHYHKSDAYEPEYASAVSPNTKAREVDRLLSEYGARPQGLQDVVLMTSDARVEDRRREYPGLIVMPIKFSSGEVGADGWKFLLGAVGNDSLYVRQIVAIMRRHRAQLTVPTLQEELASLPEQTRRLATERLALAQPYIDDEASLSTILRPGRTVIVDLRDEWIEKDEALGLFVVMMRIFAKSRFEAHEFNKLMVFDEAHKYITESDLIAQVVETIREMRHQATSVVIASQDPLSVPRAVIELTSILVLHRMTSPQWLKHLKSAISALESIDEKHVSSLSAGEALVWAQRSTQVRFTQRPQKITIRPRFTQHGGGTKTAVKNLTVR